MRSLNISLAFLIRFSSRQRDRTRERQCTKGFRKGIPSLSQGSAVFRNLEEHPPVSVKAVLLEKIDPMSGYIEPFCALLDIVVEVRCKPGNPALEPDRLVSMND